MNEKKENISLNVIRTIAALTVVVAHIRGYMMVSYDPVNSGILNKILYLGTSLGHGAVVVFFVLSGYFVGGSVFRQIRRQNFNWGRYLIARLSRLWIVLIPALALTVALDNIGLHLFPRANYYLPTSVTLINGDLLTLIGNVFFLQSTYVDSFGSNRALWSLGYEFSYYILFPLILLSFASYRPIIHRFSAAILVIALLVFLNRDVVILFSTWILGALISIFEKRISGFLQNVKPSVLNILKISSTLGTLLSMILTKIQGATHGHTTSGVMLTAITTACLVSLFISAKPRPFLSSSKRKLTSGLSGLVEFLNHLSHSSYSIYAIHLPIVVLIASAHSPVGPSAIVKPTAAGWSIVIGMVLLIVAIGHLFAALTERRTEQLRKFVEESFGSIRLINKR